MNKKIEAIDLFCGIGGLTCGFIKGGIPVSTGYDNDKTCKYGYEASNNNKFVCVDIKELTGESLFKPDTDIKILAGCPPCQPFSLQSSKYHYDETNHKKYTLSMDFLRIIKESNPHIIVMENVPNIKNKPIYTNFINELKSLNYLVSENIVKCETYGIPQKRRRLLVVASRLGTVIKINHPLKKPKTVREVFTENNLKPIQAGVPNDEDFMHQAFNMSELNLKRIKASLEGGSWKDWDDNLLMDCQKGNSFVNSYSRMTYDEPAPTLTTKCCTFGGGRYGHPVEDRGLSVREASLLQTFPIDYVFCKKEKFAIRRVSKHIGNAVPPQLAEMVAKCILQYIQEQPA